MQFTGSAVGRRGVFAFCLFVAHCCLAGGAGAAEIAVGGSRLPIVQTCDTEQYDCALQVAPGTSESVYFAWKDAANHYRVDLAASTAVLTRVLKGRPQRLASAEGAFLSARATAALLLRRRAHALYVLVNGRIALDCLDSTFAAGPVAGAHLKAVSYQPVEDVAFSDDFMRTDKEQQLGEWSRVRGTWRFHSVKETNANADFRLSVNPFSLGGRDPKGALVTVGYPFWSDYAYAVSMKSAGARAGVVFSYHAPDNYFLLLLDLSGIRPGPAGVALLRVTPSGRRVVAAGTVRAASGEWYRLGVRLLGPRVQAILDGAALFDVIAPEAAGGPCGLYTEGDAETFFDDVKVESHGLTPFDTNSALVRSGEAQGGGWQRTPTPGPRIAGDGGPCHLVHEGKGLAGYLLGDPGWQGGVFECRLRADDAGGWAGAHFAYQDARNWGLVRVRVGGGTRPPSPPNSGGAGANGHANSGGAGTRPPSPPNSGGATNGSASVPPRIGGLGGPAASGGPTVLQVIRCVNGKMTTVAEAPAALVPGRWHDLQIDCTPPGFFHVALDGRLRLRVPNASGIPQNTKASEESLGKGRVGLYTRGVQRATFQGMALRAARDVQFEQAIANQVFKNDPFMKHWASSQGQWFPVKKMPNAYWNKGDFFNAYTIALPISAGLVLAFAEEKDDFSEGYRISIEEVKGSPKAFTLHLSRLDNTIKSARLTRASESEKVVLHRSGDVIWVTQGEKQLLGMHDPQPLEGRRVGVVTPKDFDVGTIDVERENIADYPFEEAGCDWEQYGNWVITNRFSCTPTWSHMTAIGERACVLWNKYAFEGDMTVEFYAGMRMQQGRSMSYPRIGDMNVTICGDGPDLYTGYSYIVGAWDRLWSENWTRLLRGPTSVSHTDRYLAPRVRESPGGRQIEVPWVADGRPIHGAWYYIKIRRIGKRVECYFDNEKVLSYDDTNPLRGRDIAIWTQQSEMVIARARVTYERRFAPRRLLAASLPASESGRMGVWENGGTAAAAPASGRVGERVSGRTAGAGTAAGGKTAGAAARRPLPHSPIPPLSLSPTQPASDPAPLLTSATNPGLFEDFEAADSVWDPTASPRDVAVERASGGASGSKTCLRVTNASPGADLGVKVPLPRDVDATRALLQFDYCIPRAAKIHLYVTVAGQRHFIPLTAEDEDNPVLPQMGSIDVQADGKWHRAAFDLAGAILRRYPGQRPLPIQEMAFGYFHEGYLRAGIGGNGPGVSYALDNFVVATVTPAAPALVWSAPTSPEKPIFVVSYDRNPAGVPPVTQPVTTTTATPKDLPEGLWFAHVRYRKPDGAWSRSAHLPFRIAGQQCALRSTAPAGATWTGDPVVFHLSPADGPHVDPSRLVLTVNGSTIQNAARAAAYDPEKRQVAVHLDRVGMVFPDKQPIQVAVKAYTVAGGSMEGASTLVMDRSHDTRPPDPPVVKTAGIAEGFEEGVGTWAGINALVTRDATTAASGKSSLRVTNPTLGSPFAAYAFGQAFDAGRTPLLRFAYRMPQTICQNLAVAARQATVGIGFSDNSDPYPVLASIANVKQDDQWHAAEVNLREALLGLRLRPDQFQVSSLSLGDRGYSGAVAGSSYWIDDFQMVPAVSGAAGVKLSWATADPSGIQGYRYRWSTNAAEAPDTPLAGGVTEHTFTGVPEGLVYLHLQAQDSAGNWSEASHTPFLVDNTPPAIGAPGGTPGKLSSSTWSVALNDSGPSGIDPASLQLSINGRALPAAEFLTGYTAGSRTLSWEWALAANLFAGPVPDGQAVELALAPVRDLAGNASPGATFSYVVDRAGDKEPPAAPTVEITGLPAVCRDTFTRNLGQWAVYGGGALSGVDRRMDPERRDYCARLSTSGATYGYTIRSSTFDAVQAPWVAFDYRCPPGASLYFMLYINGTWYSIPLSGKSPSYHNLAAAPGFKADGQWHTMAFNYRELLRQGGLGNGSLPISSFTLWHYGSPGGLLYDIDNFQIFGSGSPNLQATWQAADATGIEGYRYLVGQSADATDGGTETTAPQAAIPDLKPGLWFVRVRARDGAGNWSAPALVSYFVSGG